MMDETDPASERPTLADGTPVVTVEQKLLYEVERTAQRHEAACEDLRRWRLANA